MCHEILFQFFSRHLKVFFQKIATLVGPAKHGWIGPVGHSCQPLHCTNYTASQRTE